MDGGRLTLIVIHLLLVVTLKLGKIPPTIRPMVGRSMWGIVAPIRCYIWRIGGSCMVGHCGM